MKTIQEILKQFEELNASEFIEYILDEFDDKPQLGDYPSFVRNIILLNDFSELLECEEIIIHLKDEQIKEYIQVFSIIGGNLEAIVLENAWLTENVLDLDFFKQDILSSSVDYLLLPYLENLKSDYLLMKEALCNKYEYEYQSEYIYISSVFLSKKALEEADKERRLITREMARKGWRLLQVIQPFATESLLRAYYELIFEREK